MDEKYLEKSPSGHCVRNMYMSISIQKMEATFGRLDFYNYQHLTTTFNAVTQWAVFTAADIYFLDHRDSGFF